MRATGPVGVDAPTVARRLAVGQFGGPVIHVGSGPRSVSVVIEVDAATEEAAYAVVLGKMGVALGPDWIVEAEPKPPPRST